MPAKIDLVTKTVACERKEIAIPTLNYWIKKGKIRQYIKDNKPHVDWNQVQHFQFKAKAIAQRRIEAGIKKPSDTTEEGGEGDGSPTNEMERLRKLQEAEYKQKDFKARQTELEYRKAAGELVSVAEVLRRWENIAQSVKKALRNLPDQLAPIMAGETDTRACWIKLSEAVDQCLENLNEEAINDYGDAIEPDNGESLDQPAEIAGADS